MYYCTISLVFCFSFLSLVPEELKSSYQTSDSGYDMYIRDAHLQVRVVDSNIFGKICLHSDKLTNFLPFDLFTTVIRYTFESIHVKKVLIT